MKKFIASFIVLLVFVSCSGTSDKELMDQATKLIKDNKVTEAKTALESLISEFPESELAPKALVQIAALYESRLIEGITPAQSFEKAEKYYYQVYEKYPQSEEAPLALFQAGFLQDEALKQYDRATKSYNLFLEKYPNHKLVPVAKQALDIMGIDPNDIINKKETAKN